MKNFRAVLSVFSVLPFFSCGDLILFTTEIESAEWADDGFKKIYVHYYEHPNDTHLQVEVYRNGTKYDGSYYVYSSEYNSFSHDKCSTIVLNKSVPENSLVKILPASDNEKVYGSCELWRKSE